jgi:hypothetical protein
MAKRRESQQAENTRGRMPRKKGEKKSPSGVTRQANVRDRVAPRSEMRAPRGTSPSPSLAASDAARDQPAAKQAAAADPRLLEIAREYRGDSRVTLGKSFSSVGLRVDNKIFAMVNRGGLVVKLPKSRVDELVSAGVATRFEPGPGRVMKEWAVFAGTKPSWASLAREAYQFVGGSGSAA